MLAELPPPWKDVIGNELTQPYFESLMNFVVSEYDRTICYPPPHEIFNAFDKCSFNDTKVVIIGQDPYHGQHQAHGLCFSVNDGVTFPPSLRNIFKEIQQDLGIAIPKSGNLTRWTRQGVLMLNATLTVRHGEAGSHQRKGWERFTDAVIAKISDEKSNVVFLLWGNFAKNKCLKVDAQKHLILESCHPSPLSANKGNWFGSRHFSRTNDYLISTGQMPIEW